MIFDPVTNFLEHGFGEWYAGQLFPLAIVGYFGDNCAVFLHSKYMVGFFRYPICMFDTRNLFAELKAVHLFFFGFHNAVNKYKGLWFHFQVDAWVLSL